MNRLFLSMLLLLSTPFMLGAAKNRTTSLTAATPINGPFPVNINVPEPYFLNFSPASWTGNGTAITISTSTASTPLSNIHIKNGAVIDNRAIQTADTGIILTGLNHVTVDDMLIVGGSVGIDIECSTDVTVNNSQFSQALDAGALVIGSTDINFNSDFIFMY